MFCAICVSKLTEALTQNENFIMEHILSKKKSRKKPQTKTTKTPSNMHFLNRFFANYKEQYAVGLYGLIETVPYKHSRKIN